MPLRAIRADGILPEEPLAIDAALVERWLVRFLADELVRRRGIRTAVVGLSGGVDSAVTAYLCARALGPENLICVRMPYATSSRASLDHAAMVIADLGCRERTIEITGAVDGYLQFEPDADGRRRGNVMARTRMLVLFDLSQRYGGLPIGTGNKSERLLGYFTWHADDAPPLNPLGDLFKTQVWALARQLGVSREIVEKAPTADLVEGLTDEGELGITYQRADPILAYLLLGYRDQTLHRAGFTYAEVQLVRRRLESTHWKRHLPTTAMLTNTAINEFYLRPVDY
ncbi:MAG: NAD+ synthase [bacterium]|nr:NAD+ synthase [bacterium]